MRRKKEREIDKFRDGRLGGIGTQEYLQNLYFKEIKQYKLLDSEGEKRLAKQIRASSGCEARNELVVHNLRLVTKIVRRYLGRGLEFLDLVQEGNIGVMKAAERFDHRLGYKFSTYATWWIWQAALRSVLNSAETIRLPVHVREMITKMFGAVARLTQELEREPTEQEIADALLVAPQLVKRLFQYLQTKSISFDYLVPAHNGHGEDLEGADILSDTSQLAPDDRLLAKEELHEASKRIRALISNLSFLGDRNRKIFLMRYGLDHGLCEEKKTLEEVSAHFLITRERVRQITVASWEKLRSLGIDRDEDRLWMELDRIQVLEGLAGEFANLSYIEQPQRQKDFPAPIAVSSEIVPVVLEKQSSDISLESQKVLQKVAQAYNFTVDDLINHDRTPSLVQARHIVMYLLRTDLALSFPNIAVLLDRDHTTILYGCKKVQSIVQKDPRGIVARHVAAMRESSSAAPQTFNDPVLCENLRQDNSTFLHIQKVEPKKQKRRTKKTFGGLRDDMRKINRLLRVLESGEAHLKRTRQRF